MPNNLPTTDTSALGQPSAHSACKLVPFEDLSDVTIDCRLRQNGQVVTQFYDPTLNGTFEARVCIAGNLRFHLCAELCLCVHIECVGPGDPKVLPCVRIPLDPCKDPLGVEGENKACYDFDVAIPSGHLTAEECGSFCCFVATLSSFTICVPPRPGFIPQPGHICCYCKGPCVMVCNPPEHPFP